MADAVATGSLVSYNDTARQNLYPGMAAADIADEVKQLASVMVTLRPLLSATPPRPPASKPSPTRHCSTPVLPIPTPPVTLTASLVSPAAGSLVEQGFVVAAQVSAIPSGYQLWTMLQVVGPENHPTYQRNNCAVTTRTWPGPLPLRLAADGLYKGHGPQGVSATMGTGSVPGRRTPVSNAGSS